MCETKIANIREIKSTKNFFGLMSFSCKNRHANASCPRMCRIFSKELASCALQKNDVCISSHQATPGRVAVTVAYSSGRRRISAAVTTAT